MYVKLSMLLFAFFLMGHKPTPDYTECIFKPMHHNFQIPWHQ